MKISRRSLRAPGAQEVCLTNVYVWEWPVRLTHWLTAGSIWVLSVTGIYIGFPFLIVSGEAAQAFWTGRMRVIHLYAAIVFTLSVLSRLLWMFMGNRYARWYNFIPVTRERWRGMARTVRYYLFGLRLPPGYVGHNPLAGLTYAFLFLAFLVQIATGFALYAGSASYASPMRVFAFLGPLFGGLQSTRFIHHLIMWLIWPFFVHHVYSAILMSQVEPTATVESIFSGHKFVPAVEVASPQSRFADERAAAPAAHG
jgi:Ni/Fe-hydrogenase 1 B-type cytochrome subunit